MTLGAYLEDVYGALGDKALLSDLRWSLIIQSNMFKIIAVSCITLRDEDIKVPETEEAENNNNNNNTKTGHTWKSSLSSAEIHMCSISQDLN